MKKQDIIRIINEEVDIALDEMYDPIYDSMLPEILAMLAAGAAGVKMAIKHLKSKGLDKQSIIDVIKKAKSKLDESLEATNKKTGKDVTKHVNDYMAGDIDKKEFEKLTGLKKESVNETTKHTIVVYNGKRLAVEPGDIERLKSGKDVVGNSTKYAGQEEWIPARGKWKIEESINENEDPFGLGVSPHFSKIHKMTLKKFNVKSLKEIPKDKQEEVLTYIDTLASKYYVNENEGMTKSLKDIDPSLSLTTYGTKPPSFKITYRVKDDMSKEMEQELVAWVLSKGGVVESVSNDFDVEDRERYYYPYVKFSYK